MNTDIVTEKKKILYDASEKLKHDFKGIDNIIDDIIKNITFWYCHSEFEMYPTIINLWGMTGVGKTDLVIKLVRYLKIKKFLNIDVSKHKELNLDRMMISHELWPKDKCVILFDEFQKLGSANKNFINNDFRSSSIWEFTSSWKFQDTLRSIKTLREEKNNLIMNYNIIIEKESERYWRLRSEIWHSGIITCLSFTDEEKKEILKLGKIAILKKTNPGADLINLLNINNISELSITRLVYLLAIIGIDYLLYIINKKITVFQNKWMNNEENDDEFIYSKALIFVCGNLNDMYKNITDTNHINDIDSFYNAHKNVSLKDVNAELNSLFTVEKVSRLGPIHILYPIFDTKIFKSIIELIINKILIKCYNTHNVKIKLNNKLIVDEIIKNVNPSLGVRPVISEVHQKLSFLLPKYILDIKSGTAEDKRNDKGEYIF